DDRGLAGHRALGDGRGDPAGEDRAAGAVAEGAGRHAQWVFEVRRRDRGGDAAAGPEGDGVEAALLRVRTLGARAAAEGVDQVGVARPDVVDVDAVLAARRRQQAGQEDVGVGQQPVQDVERAVDVQVQGDAALAAVVVLPGEDEAMLFRGDVAGGQGADRIARRRL